MANSLVIIPNWSNNQRLKRNSPYSQVISDNIILPSVERHHLSSYTDPSEGLPGVYFHPNLTAHVNKTSDPPEFLRQLVLEVISNIPDDTFLTYTDDSRNEHSRSGGSIYVKSQNYCSHTKLRNSDGVALSFPVNSFLLIQALKRDFQFLVRIASGYYLTVVVPSNIFLSGISLVITQEWLFWRKLKLISSSREIHLQSVPSNVNISDNEISDALAKDDTAQPFSSIQNYTLRTSTTSKQLFLLLITGMWLNVLVALFPFNVAGKNKLF
ncbi:UNVERIFIED_CONTAM: hypothetical protein NCL1_17091 [Trichonephila clavipes]